MARRNVWEDWRPVGWEDDAIERHRFVMLESSAKPFGISSCREAHGCPRCFGWGEVQGATCRTCNGSGVGSIKGGEYVYCPFCDQTGVEDDPRLVIRPGELPRRERTPASPASKPKPELKIARPDDEPVPQPPKKRGRPRKSLAN
jgi:hypothetical protein